MKIVVTGGLGFVGRNFASYMRRKTNSIELHAIDWFSDASKADLALFDSATVACFASDAARDVYHDADIVVHLAATTTVQESIEDPHKSFVNNVVKTQSLLDHLRDVAPKAHFVFASTGGAIIGEHDGPINEAIPPRPISPYGATKLAVEGLLTSYSASFDMPAASMRFSNVYGPMSERKTSVVAAFCKAYLKTGHLYVNGSGHQTRDYVFVDDVCRAIWLVIQKRATGPFQLGTGVGTSILDLIEVMRSAEPGLDLTISYRAPLNGEVRHNVCDIGKARAELGFEPEFDLQRGVDATLAWFQKHAA